MRNNGWHPPVKIGPPLQGGAKNSQGGAQCAVSAYYLYDWMVEAYSSAGGWKKERINIWLEQW